MFGYRPLAESVVLHDGPAGHTHSGTGSSGGGLPDGPIHPDILDARAIQRIFAALPPDVRQNGRQIDEFHWKGPDGRIYALSIDANGNPTFEKWTEGDSADFLKSVASGGSGGGSGRLASDDPRYWANLDRQYGLDVRALDQELIRMGFTDDAQRRQALAQLIANRNNTALGVADTSAGIAKTIADYTANPRDAVAELIYRNQVGGVAPFSDTNNNQFGEYGKALAAKAESIFSPVQKDLGLARDYARSVPPVEFFGSEIRDQLGLPPTPAQAILGGTGGGLPASTATAPTNANGLQSLMDRLNTMSEADKDAFRRWTTATAPKAMAQGGALNFDGMFDSRSKPGFSPSSSEGGTNLNLHERAIVVGESGQVYATLGEKRPDGTVRAEQLQIKPLKSEVEKDKKLAEAGKAITETQNQTLKSFATGGTIDSTADDFMQQLQQLLSRLGGQGGGTDQPLSGGRFLAGAPANALLDDPVLKDYTDAAYSAKGIDPRTLWADIKRFTPADAMRVGQTRGRVNFLGV